MKQHLRLAYLLTDTLGSILAWTAFFLFRKLTIDSSISDTPLPTQLLADPHYWLGLLAVTTGWLLLYTLIGSYRDLLRKARLKEFLETFTATLIGCVIIFFTLLIDDNITTYRNYYTTFLFLFSVQFLLTYIPRLLITSHTVHLIHTRQLGFPTLLVGSGDRALQTYLNLENQETYSGNLFIGYIDPSPTPSTSSPLASIMPCLGSPESIPNLIAQHHIQEVILALDDNQQHLTNPILIPLLAQGNLFVKINPNGQTLPLGAIHQQAIFHSPLITIRPRTMPEWQYSIKRLADIVLSLIAMLLLSPVYLLTAILVKATSPGPILYAQERIGLHGKPFRMHKFRSMYIDAEQTGPALASDDDPRITPFGRFMRKVRLDEIPQFYNVLRGTMSLVGPRPERQFYIDQIIRRAPEYLLLQRIKPGITSWGQVKYGYASTVDQMVERLRYDLLYLDNMTILTDLKILIYTVIIIIQGRGK